MTPERFVQILRMAQPYHPNTGVNAPYMCHAIQHLLDTKKITDTECRQCIHRIYYLIDHEITLTAYLRKQGYTIDNYTIADTYRQCIQWWEEKITELEKEINHAD